MLRRKATFLPRSCTQRQRWMQQHSKGLLEEAMLQADSLQELMQLQAQ